MDRQSSYSTTVICLSSVLVTERTTLTSNSKVSLENTTWLKTTQPNKLSCVELSFVQARGLYTFFSMGPK